MALAKASKYLRNATGRVREAYFCLSLMMAGIVMAAGVVAGLFSQTEMSAESGGSIPDSLHQDAKTVIPAGIFYGTPVAGSGRSPSPG